MTRVQLLPSFSRIVKTAAALALAFALQACSRVNVALDMYCIGLDGVLITDQALAEKCCNSTGPGCPVSTGPDVLNSYSGTNSGNITITNSIEKNVRTLRELLSGSEILAGSPQAPKSGPISEAATASGPGIPVAPSAPLDFTKSALSENAANGGSGAGVSSGSGAGGSGGASFMDLSSASRSRGSEEGAGKKASGDFGNDSKGALSGGAASGSRKGSGGTGGVGSLASVFGGGGNADASGGLGNVAYEAYALPGSGQSLVRGEDPEDYFSRLTKYQSLFDVVSARYANQQVRWGRDQLRQLKQNQP